MAKRAPKKLKAKRKVKAKAPKAQTPFLDFGSSPLFFDEPAPMPSLDHQGWWLLGTIVAILIVAALAVHFS